MDKNLDLNTDTSLHGFIVHSSVSKPQHLANRPNPQYSVDIELENPGDAMSIAMLLDSYMGPDCINREETVKQIIDSNTIRFESMHKPLTSGADPTTGEFQPGQRVRVSCQFRLRDGEISSTGEGQFKFPDYQLRFVDLAEPEPAVKMPAPSPEVLACYDF